jgi:hypothetical protein
MQRLRQLRWHLDLAGGVSVRAHPHSVADADRLLLVQAQIDPRYAGDPVR